MTRFRRRWPIGLALLSALTLPALAAIVIAVGVRQCIDSDATFDVAVLVPMCAALGLLVLSGALAGSRETRGYAVLSWVGGMAIAAVGATGPPPYVCF
jgi:hypothetical protein